MHRGVRLDERVVWQVHGDNGDVCDLPRWEFVRGWRRPACCVFMRRWLLFGSWCGHSVCVCVLHGWQLVRWRLSRSGAVHVHGGLLFWCRCGHDVRRHGRGVRDVPCRAVLCWCLCCAEFVHV